MTPVPDISVVVPAYNRLDSVLALLADLDRQEGAAFEVIVVDDHSAEDPTSAIAALFPRVTVLRNAVNGGPAVSRNRGIRAARGALVVGFDSDVTVPDPGVLRRVAAILAVQPTVDGLAFRLLKPDGKADDAPRWWHPVPLAGYASKRFCTSYFSGTAYAFRREAIFAAGLFPEILFMHYEEVELAYRLLDRGGTILYCPEIRVLHHAHPVSRRSEIKVFYKPRNQILLAVTCLPWPRAFFYAVPRLVFQFFVALKDGHLSAYFRALRSVVERLPACRARRQVLQSSTFRRLAELRAGVLA